MAECYKYKHQSDIKRNFKNNLDIIIEMPRYHAEVLWDLGIELSSASGFAVSSRDQLRTGHTKKVGTNIDQYERISMHERDTGSMRRESLISMDATSTSIIQ